jgi:hypothetical protein
VPHPFYWFPAPHRILAFTQNLKHTPEFGKLIHSLVHLLIALHFHHKVGGVCLRREPHKRVGQTVYEVLAITIPPVLPPCSSKWAHFTKLPEKQGTAALIFSKPPFSNGISLWHN